MVTLAIRGGRRDKLGADVLGTLTSPGGGAGIAGREDRDRRALDNVAIERSIAA